MDIMDILEQISQRTWELLSTKGIKGLKQSSYEDLCVPSKWRRLFPKGPAHLIPLALEFKLPSFPSFFESYDDLFDFVMSIFDSLIPNHSALQRLFQDSLEDPNILVALQCYIQKKSNLLLKNMKAFSHNFKDVYLLARFQWFLLGILRCWLKNPEDERLLVEVDQGLKKIFPHFDH